MTSRSITWFFVGSFGLSTVLSYLGGFSVSSLVQRTVQTESTAAEISTPKPVTTPKDNSRKRKKTVRQDQYINSIVNRSIFDSALAGQNSVTTSAPADGDSVASSLRLTLILTITATPEEFSVALIQNDDGGYAQTYGIGYELLDQATVTKIEPNRVYFLRKDNQQIEYIEIGADKGTEKVAAKTGGKPADDGDIQKIGNNKYVVEQAVLDEILANPEKLYTQVRVTPHKDESGDIDGYRMTGIRRKSLFYKLGIKNGDIVHSVNGQSLTSLSAAMDAYNSLGNSRAFNFDITRRKNKQTFEYEVR